MTGKINPSKSDVQLLNSIVPVSRETMEIMQVYVDLLAQWQVKINLVSNSTLGDVWRRHICDSAQCKEIMPEASTWLDLGSGAGFPGLVVAILGRSEPELDVQLVESNGKKCAFLRKVIRETGVAATVINDRIESVTKQIGNVDVLTARAVAPLDRLFEYSCNWLDNGSAGLFQKGRDYMRELEYCRGAWEFDLVKHDSRTRENSVILEVRNLKKTDLQGLAN